MFAIAIKGGAAGACAAALAVIVLLAGCETVSLPTEGDPNIKLARAEFLVNGPGRMVQARRITEQAIVLFQRQGDKAGLARAYREYGLIALGGGLADDPYILRDPSAPLQPKPEDLDRAQDSLKRALDLAEQTEQRYMAANINFVLGNIEVLRGTPQRGCPYFSAALKGYRDAAAQLPGVKLYLPPGVTDPVNYVERAKKDAGCGGEGGVLKDAAPAPRPPGFDSR